MIALVVLDLDGTLIGSSGQVSECVWEAAQRARQSGIKLATCTGRPGAGVALRVAERLGPRHGHIFQSGALIADPSGNTINVAALREAVVLDLVAKAREADYSLELYTPTTLYVERRTELSDAHAKMIGVTPLVRDLSEVARIEPVVRAQWVVEEARRAEVESLSLLQGVQISTASSPALPKTAFISVTREGVHKGTAVRQLAEVMSIDKGAVMGVGDSEGDLPMLKEVAHPYVMPSASYDLRSTYPTLSNDVDDCGVVEALEQAIESRVA